jgi:RHS repeat-associated protein
VLNQMTAFGRGTLSADRKSIGSTSHTQSWTLDALGNWKQFNSDTTMQTRMANQQNEVVQISGASNPAFDNNGNTIQDDQGNVLKYDAWNRLVKVTGGMLILGKYHYDALGRRITSKVGQVITDRYYSDQWQVLEEDQGGAMTQQYVWSPVYVDALIDRDSAGGQRLYAQQDANWNVTGLVDTTGAVQERFIYDPYGKPTDASGQNVSALNPNWTTETGGDSYGWVYLHQGGRYDALTGLYNFRHRDYSPTLGRWIEEDPLNLLAGDRNLYRAFSDNPPTDLDSSGQAAEKGPNVDFINPSFGIGQGIPVLSRWTGNEMDMVQKATTNACNCIAKALDLVENHWDQIRKFWPRGGPNFNVLFTNRAQYKQMLQKVNKGCNSAKIQFCQPCFSPKCKEEDTVAYAPKGGPINLCPVFWDKKTDKVGTIIHEFGRVFLWDELPDDGNFKVTDIRVWDSLVDKLCSNYDGVKKA